MAPSDRLVGSNMQIDFLPAGGTPGVDEITLSADYTAFSYNRQVDVVDVTAGNELNRYVKDTIESMDGSITFFDATQSYANDILPRAQGLMTVYAEGVGSGLPYFAMNIIITGYSEEMPFDGALEIELSWQRQGAMVTEIGSTQA